MTTDACPSPERLTAHVHGEADLSGHLQVCDRCGKAVEELRRVDSLLLRAPAPAALGPDCPPDDRLGGRARAGDAHVADCAACLERLAVQDDLRRAPALPADLRRRLLPPRKPATRRRRTRRFPATRSWGTAAAAAAALALFAVLAAVATRRPSKAEPARALARAVDAREDYARRAEERLRMEEELAELERERRRLAEKRGADQARMEQLEREQGRKEREVARIREQERQAAEALALPSRPPAVTVAAVAILERAEGEVLLVTPEGRRPAAAGLPLLEGQSLSAVGAFSAASFVYPDGSRIDLSGDAVASLRDGVDGKRLFLSRGQLRADVARQPDGRALEIATPQATARVLGTTLRIVAEPGETRLDVTAGRVRLTRDADGRAVEVVAGHFAVASPGRPLESRSLADPAIPALAGFTLIDARTGEPVRGYDPIPEGAVLDFSKLPTTQLNIRANTVPERVGSVLFGFDGNPRFGLQNGRPYSAFGGQDGRWFAWQNPKPGLHALTATPYTGPRATGTAGRSLTLRFTVKR